MSETSKIGARRFGLVVLGILFTLAVLIGIASAGFGLVVGPFNAIGVAFNVPALKDSTVSYVGVTCYGWALIPLSIIAIVAACYGIPSGYRWIKKSFEIVNNDAKELKNRMNQNTNEDEKPDKSETKGDEKQNESERKEDIPVETEVQVEPSE